jgi:hypothetical protein
VCTQFTCFTGTKVGGGSALLALMPITTKLDTGFKPVRMINEDMGLTGAPLIYIYISCFCALNIL